MTAPTRRIAREEGGFTLTEMLVVMLVLGILMTGLVNVLVSGTHAQYVMDSQLNAQQNVRLALSRLEYEGRCATTATVVGSGEGVVFSLPPQCTHATGTVTWCVVSGSLKRFTSAGCTGSGQLFVSQLTSPTPFSLVTATGDLPQLVVALTSSPTGRPVDVYQTTDTITLRNSSAS